MPSFYSRGSSKNFRRGVYRLGLTLPILAASAYSSSGDLNHIKNLEFERSISIEMSQLNINELNSKESSRVVLLAQVNEDKDPSDKSIKESDEKRVLISEVIIKGIEGHLEQERLEFHAYDAMKARPGARVTRAELKRDLDAIYATGWFSRVRIEPVNGPLGVQLVVEVEPNPVLTSVKLNPKNSKLPKSIIRRTFKSDFGRTLNLNVLRLRMNELKEWYSREGYSLARISGPNRVTSKGVVQLEVIEGTVAGIEVKFLNKEGEENDDKGNLIAGKTKDWVITREISIRKGEVFNRKDLESDLKRLYGTSLFSDVKVTLRPVPGEPGKVVIVLGITEQSTGSLSGGIGYSQSQGVFGQVGLQDSNLIGRAWNASLNLTYGEYGGLANISFSDPWIKGDLHRTSFRTSLFLSREVPQSFRSQENGTIRSVYEYYDVNSTYAYDINSDEHTRGKFNTVAEAKSSDLNTSWFDYRGDSVVLQRTGGNFIFSRPLNGGNPYKKAPWSVLVGMNIQKVRPIDYAGRKRPYGVATKDIVDGKVQDGEVICVAFNCETDNDLFGIRAAATYNNLDNARNPTSGDYLSLGTEQFLSIGNNSPTFNRARASYTYFVPVNWLKVAKGCRPKKGEKADCPQAIGFQLKAGTVLGQLPPYEAFCLGGANSIRGWNSCGLSVGRSFGEASVEYRFPIWNIVSGELFVDGGTDFGSQANVPGKPGKLLEKPGSGFSLGSGVIVNTPVGPLRLEAASKGFDGDWRFNLGVGWKF